MRKLFLLLLIIICLNIVCNAQTSTNYNEIFENLPHIDIEFVENEDPYEYLQYQHYTYSPYPLIKSALNLKTKRGDLAPGLYLLTPREQNGFNFVLFKQKGKIKAIVPVYEKQEIYPEVEYKRENKKSPLWKKPFNGAKKLGSMLFGRYKRPKELPKQAFEAYFVDGYKYYVMNLYFENYSYKMLFKVVH